MAIVLLPIIFRSDKSEILFIAVIFDDIATAFAAVTPALPHY